MEMTATTARTSYRLADYFALGKPRVVVLIAVTVAVGFVVGSGPVIDLTRLLATVVLTSVAGAGALALNQLIEREQDRHMRRTAQRPLPAGRLEPTEALAFGALLVVTGLAGLSALVDPVAALVTAVTVALYLFVYTPLKRRSTISTLVGALPGALPPMTGWVAACGELGPGAWSLFGLMFFWQIPHSLAIARLYRDEYAAAGFRLLPVVDPDGRSTGRQVLLHAVALVAAGLVPSLIGIAGPAYVIVGLILGIGVLVLSAEFWHSGTTASARRLFIGSLVYMPILLALLAFDRVPR